MERVFEELNKLAGEFKPGKTGTAEFPKDEIPPLVFPKDTVLEPSRIGGRPGRVEEYPTTHIDPSIGEAVQKQGTDVLAFYKSFRFIEREPFPGRWGIFYLKEGLMILETVLNGMYGYTSPQTGDLVRKLLSRHEYLHFKVDVSTLFLEVAMKEHLYLPYFYAYEGKHSHCVEEALANQAMLRMERDPVVLQFLHSMLSHQPNAYARYMEPEEDLHEELVSNILIKNYSKSKVKGYAEWVRWLFLMIPSMHRSPEYIIHGNFSGQMAGKTTPSVKTGSKNKKKISGSGAQQLIDSLKQYWPGKQTEENPARVLPVQKRLPL
jgi:hypothetical protein